MLQRSLSSAENFVLFPSVPHRLPELVVRGAPRLRSSRVGHDFGQRHLAGEADGGPVVRADVLVVLPHRDVCFGVAVVGAVGEAPPCAEHRLFFEAPGRLNFNIYDERAVS